MVSSSSQRWLLAAITALVILYVVTSILFKDVAEKAIALAALLSWLNIFIYQRHLLRSFVVGCFVAALLAQFLSWGLSMIEIPELAENSPKLHRMGVWFYVIPIAFAIGGDRRKVLMLFAIAGLSLLASAWIGGEGLRELYRGIKGSRIDFSIHNAQHTGMLFGVLLIGLLSFVRPILGRHKAWLWPRLVIWSALVASCFAVIIFTWTRGVWLGLLVAELVACVMVLSLATGAAVKRFVVALMLLALVCGVSIHQSGLGDIVYKRILAEQSVLSEYLEDPVNGAAGSSTTVRLSTWVQATRWIAERPFFGWGGKGRSAVVESTENISTSVRFHTRHLHNIYLDVAVNYGAVGLLIFFALIGYLLHASYRLWKSGPMPVDYLLFYWSFISFWLVVNVFESFMFFSTGIFVFSIVGGSILSLYWKAKMDEGVRVELSADDQ